jgi:hypothetical protein
MKRDPPRGDSSTMNAAAPRHDGSAFRGASRLLADCARVGRAPFERPSARARLESELGVELARRLVDGLAAGPRRALV